MRERGLDAALLKRRVVQRRNTLLLQICSYATAGLTMMIFAYSGTISITIAVGYVLSGFSLSLFFMLLSETHFNDRFDDHYLTISQVGGNVAVQIGFLLAAPQIGFAFIGVLFLIFSFSALRMTTWQAVTSWSIMSIGVAPVFLLTDLPIGMPTTNPIDRVATMLCVILTIGQCALAGLFGSSVRRRLSTSRYDLRIAYRRIEELAELDELTGAYNRRCVMRLLTEELARAQRLQHPCAIALIDLDWFKRINDTFGHPTGDEVLRTFAITMFANIREIDKFGRYGGEEFLLVLPETTMQAATRMLERLRLIVSELDWSAFSPDMIVTISAGVASVQPGETPEALLARADRALYAAKGGGRNRIANA